MNTFSKSLLATLTLSLASVFISPAYADSPPPVLTQFNHQSVTTLPISGDKPGHTGNPNGARFFNYNAMGMPASVFNGLEDFTIGAWVNLRGLLMQNTLLSVYNNDDDNAFVFSYLGFDGEFEVIINGSRQAFPVFLDNQYWHYWSVVRRGNQVTVYLDGQSIGTKTMTDSPIVSESVIVGQEQDCRGGCFDSNQSLYGSVDNIDVVRGSVSKTAMVATGLNTLWSYWNFDGIELGHNPAEGALSRALTISTTSDLYQIDKNNVSFLNDFTIASWVKLNHIQTSGYQANTLISMANSSTDNALTIWFDGDREAFGVKVNGSSAKYFSTQHLSTGSNSPSDLAWHYWKVVRDNGMLSLYLDGVKLGTHQVTTNSVQPESIYIGQELDCLNGCFDPNQTLFGEIEDLTILRSAAAH